MLDELHSYNTEHQNKTQKKLFRNKNFNKTSPKMFNLYWTKNLESNTTASERDELL